MNGRRIATNGGFGGMNGFNDFVSVNKKEADERSSVLA